MKSPTLKNLKNMKKNVKKLNEELNSEQVEKLEFDKAQLQLMIENKTRQIDELKKMHEVDKMTISEMQIKLEVLKDEIDLLKDYLSKAYELRFESLQDTIIKLFAEVLKK